MTAPNHMELVFLQVYFVVFFQLIFCNPIISVTVLGSLLPDIDHTKSWIGKSSLSNC
jgi:inner membrane protein